VFITICTKGKRKDLANKDSSLRSERLYVDGIGV